MKAMSDHIRLSGRAEALRSVLKKEIEDNKSEVSVNPQWSQKDRDAVGRLMDAELSILDSSFACHEGADSVKGEDAMPAAYPGYAGKATDAITLCDGGELVLSEAKYLIRVGGRGPFGPVSFKTRVSRKFDDMTAPLMNDGETIMPIRVVVVTEEQLPLSMIHVRGLLHADYPQGSFSSDGSQHDYVLCSSRGLDAIMRNPAAARRKSQDYLFFRI